MLPWAIATSATYEYNEDGIRISKTAGGAKHTYYLNGTQIVAEEWGNKLLIYLYDKNGAPIGMQYRTTSYAEGVFDTYWFEKNLQGDIVAVYNDAGTLLATYAYDAWGGIASLRYSSGGSSTAAQYNPFRYRGYYRDSETGFYYLNSRYYDPNTGRFINADGQLNIDHLLGTNLYAYCYNNPVNMDDSQGNFPKWLSGVLNVVSGVAQMGAGAALGAFTSWTGVGAVAAGFLAVNGAATAAQGIGQIVNDLTQSSYLYEDNIVRAGAQSLGESVGGETGALIAGGVYDAMVIAASVYSARVAYMNRPQVSSSKAPANPGVPFRPGQKGLQMGVDPNTLTPSKDLSTLSSQRIADAIKYAGDREIIVGITGVIHQGHHRVADAIANGRALDIWVEAYK